MKAAIDQQRIHFKDPSVLPPGKVLEMATIDGYKSLGLDRELGSIEPGKQADIMTVNLFQPHLYPLDMLVYRLVYNATGSDVADVSVGGRLVMENRKLLTVDETTNARIRSMGVRPLRRPRATGRTQRQPELLLGRGAVGVTVRSLRVRSKPC